MFGDKPLAARVGGILLCIYLAVVALRVVFQDISLAAAMFDPIIFAPIVTALLVVATLIVHDEILRKRNKREKRDS